MKTQPSPTNNPFWSENDESAYRIIMRLQYQNVKLFDTLKSCVAWIRLAGGDCVTLDAIIAAETESVNNSRDAIRAIESANAS